MTTKDSVISALVAGAVSLAGIADVRACSSNQQKAAAADSAYLAAQMKCIDDAQTATEADDCRDRVKAQWTVDAGKDGAK